MKEPRDITRKEKEHILRLAIRHRDKALIKRIRKGLVKDNEYRWHIKQMKGR